ncbi:MAG TPA: sulfurtransferase TusA family protein [Nitrososphaerales archaeon]|nr:sulfurtransferase TusA family protein [Nitrososphaerales archaeon]
MALTAQEPKYGGTVEAKLAQALGDLLKPELIKEMKINAVGKEVVRGFVLTSCPVEDQDHWKDFEAHLASGKSGFLKYAVVDGKRILPGVVVESRGIWCPPTPMTDLYRAWRKSDLGDVIELRASEPNIEADVRAWAKRSGNKVLEVTKEKEYTRLLVKVTKKGKEVLEMPAVKVDLNQPDETKVTPKGKLQLVTIGDFTFGVRTLEPGWKWTEHMRPIAKTETCEIRHIGYVISGRMGFLMNDGTELEVGPGEAFDVRSGHDAWTVGDAPFIFVDMIGAVEGATDATRAP